MKRLDEILGIEAPSGAKYRRYACSYMSDVGYLYGYIAAENPTFAAGEFLAMIRKHDKDYNTEDQGGAFSKDGSQGFVMGHHWCLQVVDLDDLVQRMFPTDELVLTRGSGKSVWMRVPTRE